MRTPKACPMSFRNIGIFYIDFKIFFVLVSGPVEDHKSMSSVTSLEYWNILDFEIFFVPVRGIVEDHKSMSNVTSSQYWNILDFKIFLYQSVV